MNIEAIADLIGIDGVLGLLVWAEGRQVIVTENDGKFIWTSDEYKIVDGKLSRVRCIARCEALGNGKARVIFAGSAVERNDWNLNTLQGNGGWEEEYDSIDDAMRAKSMAGRRTCDGKTH